MPIATRDDVLACYRNILGREPENEETLNRLVGWDFWALVHRFSHSDEHRMRIGRASSHSILKCLNSGYLARGLPTETRASAIIYNYAVLRQRLAPAHFLSLLEHGLPVVCGASGRSELVVEASLFDGPVNEGEISLIASWAGRRLGVLTFTIVDGADFGLARSCAMLVSRIQGYRGVGEDLRAATRALAGIAPPLLLIAALEGVAGAFGIRSALCVGASNHPCFREDMPDQLTGAYDDLLVTLGAERLASGFYHLSLPHIERSLESAPATHRARKRRRREARRAIVAQAQACWTTYLRHEPQRFQESRQPEALRRQSRPKAVPSMGTQKVRTTRRWPVGLIHMWRSAYRKTMLSVMS